MLLPDVPPEVLQDVGSFDFETDDMEAPKVVPDLLPPCTSNPGDTTLEFFRACMGELDHHSSKSEEKYNSGDYHDETTEATDPDSNAITVLAIRMRSLSMKASILLSSQVCLI